MFIDALEWLGGEGSNPLAIAERRAEGLLATNHGLLRDFGVCASTARRAGKPGLVLQTSTRIGAIPLLSPISARTDFGLVIEPRFSWSSAGEMLAGTGFRVLPEFLPLPDLPQSERRVPPWVLSSIVLTRLKRLLDALQRRFVNAQIDRRAPHGAVDWNTYATQRFAIGRALDIPCRYPDLSFDDELRSIIHWTVRRHREALFGQIGAGIVVRRLIELCDTLLTRLAGTRPRVPENRLRVAWNGRPLSTRVFREGLQAIDWTLEERGLAGLSDLSGLSWHLDMEVFFEAWVEAIAEHAAQRLGARLRVGRKNQTRVPLDWQPPATGSQRSLLPDIVMEGENTVLVLDAKYKRHAEEIARFGWHDLDRESREQHRNDVLQALAYSTLFDFQRIVACLVYPASQHKWGQLADQGRVVSRAVVRSSPRRVELALMAVPLSGKVSEPAAKLEGLFRSRP